MRVRLLVRWNGNDRAQPGDVIQVDDDVGAHLILRNNAVLPDAPTPLPAPIVEPVGDDLEFESRALVAVENAEAVAAAAAPKVVPSKRHR